MTKPIVTSLIFAVAFLGGAGALKWAEARGMIDAATVSQIVQIVLGLMVAAYANVMPKQVARKGFSPQAAKRAQSAVRFGGWTLTLAGLAYAALWAFTPNSFADTAALIVLATATAATLVYATWMFTSCRSTTRMSGS